MKSRISLALITFYQRCVSPLFPSCCRFYPTCSAYMKEAIRRFGFLRGGWIGFLRFLRCNPFCRGGVDPVPDRFSFLPKKSGR